MMRMKICLCYVVVFCNDNTVHMTFMPAELVKQSDGRRLAGYVLFYLWIQFQS